MTGESIIGGFTRDYDTGTAASTTTVYSTLVKLLEEILPTRAVADFHAYLGEPGTFVCILECSVNHRWRLEYDSMYIMQFQDSTRIRKYYVSLLFNYIHN